jgi:hypothetical protein
VSEKDGRVLLHCHAGCSPESIVEALGLRISDLFLDGKSHPHSLTLEALARAKALPADFLRGLGLREQSNKVVIPYSPTPGPRNPRQRFRTALVAREGSFWDKGQGEIVPYGTWRLAEARKAGFLILPEGESDSWTCWYHGFPALGIPGADMVKVLKGEHLEGFSKVYIMQETDAAGAHFVTALRQRLSEVAWTGETKVVGLGPIKDVNELHCADPAKFKGAFQAALDSAQDAAIWKATSSTEGFTLKSLGELLKKPTMPVDYIVNNLLVAGTTSAVVGKPKAGKGTLARNLALAVARGDDFLGFSTRQGEVIYLALEEREADVRDDFRAMGADGGEPILIHAAAAPADGIRALCDLVRDRKPLLVVIDTLFRLVRIKDECAYAETYAALGPLVDAARETGTHIQLVHHAGKTPKTDAIDAPLGSTAIGGAVCTLVVLKRTERYRTVQTVQRIGQDMPEIVLRFDPETRRLSVGGTRFEADTAATGEEILAFLEAATEPKGEAVITEAVEGRTRIVREALRQLVRQGKVSREGQGKKGSPYTYSKCSFSCSQEGSGTREQESEKAPENLGESEAKFSFSCSAPYGGTREQECGKVAQTRVPTDKMLVPAESQKPILVPGFKEGEI